MASTAAISKREASAEDQAVCRRVDDGGEECGKPLDTTGYPIWCKACRAKHRVAYNATVKEMSETRGFAAGVSAAKAFVASEFETAIRGSMINGFEAARLVRACKGPALPAS